MIRDEFMTNEDVVDNYDSYTEIEDVGTVYVKNSHTATPEWAVSFFNEQLNTNNLFSANARAVAIVRISTDNTETDDPEHTKTFAIVMGYGKNMLKDNVIEERFGLKVILNTIKQDSLRRINKINIGGNQKLSSEQLPLKSGISDFGLDINRDLVSNIAGVSDDDQYVTGILAGGDILSLTAEVDISNIVDFLKKTYRKYKLTTYTRNFAWIDQIQDVKDTRLIELLDAKLIEAVNIESQDIWMAVPELIEWSEVKGFKYAGSQIHDDIDIEKVRGSFREPLIRFDQLKGKKITVISALDDSQLRSWAASKCLFGEIMLNNKAYCINSGKWYCINTDFVQQVNNDYSRTKISPIVFDEFNANHDSEHAYSKSFTDNHIDQYILMDADNIAYGGGHSSIELCDILSEQKEMIHIKPYSGSSTLSHLFSQAAVSAELVLSDNAFLIKANERILQKAPNLNFEIIDRRKIKVVFGIITKYQEPLPRLPFFSMVSFRYTKRRLEAFGFDVSIKNILNVKDAS